MTVIPSHEGRGGHILVVERATVPSAEFVYLLYGVGSTNSWEFYL